MKRILPQDWNRITSYGAMILFYFVFGLLLLLWPGAFLKITSLCIAVLLCVSGIRCIISYVRSSALEGALGMELALGLAALCVGVLIFCFPELLQALLPFLWGISLLIGGFGKVQMSVDMKRIGDSYWWILLIGSAVSFVLGVFAITQPTFLATAMIQFVGISLIVEGVQDLVAFISLNHRIRTFRKALEQAANQQ